jgi:hypothetical protein
LTEPRPSFREDRAYGGFVASQAQITNDQPRNFAGPSSQIDQHDRIPVPAEPEEGQLAARVSGTEPTTPEVFAHSVEFVTLPGRSKELQRTIPETLRCALGNSGGFFGCMVFVSKQEERLMTVITLWTGRERAEQCDKISDRLHQVLLPYVDCWLRTQRMTTFLCWRQECKSSNEHHTPAEVQKAMRQ